MGCVEPSKITCWQGFLQSPTSSHPFVVAAGISISPSTARFLLLHDSVQFECYLLMDSIWHVGVAEGKAHELSISKPGIVCAPCFPCTPILYASLLCHWLPFSPSCCQCPVFPLPQPMALWTPPAPLASPVVMLCISPTVFSLSILSFIFSQPAVQVVSSRMGKTCKVELPKQGEVETVLRIWGVNGSLEEPWKYMVMEKWLKKTSSGQHMSPLFSCFLFKFWASKKEMFL